MKKRSILFMLMMLFACSLMVIPSGKTYAASAKSKAIKAYKKKLSKSTVAVFPKGLKVYDEFWEPPISYKSTKSSQVTFALAYITKDNVPELIIKDPKYGYASFTYKKGKVKRLQHWDNYDFPHGYYKKKGIFMNYASSEGTPHTDMYYKVTGSKAELVMDVFFDGNDPLEYKVNKKEVSASQFKKARKSYVGKTKLTKIKMRKNTKANRKKYMK